MQTHCITVVIDTQVAPYQVKLTSIASMIAPLNDFESDLEIFLNKPEQRTPCPRRRYCKPSV